MTTETKPQAALKVEKAKVSDVPQLHSLINHFADRDEMLHRSLNELYENIRDYFVVRENGRVLGCAALHVNWEDLAELKALAVLEERQGEGIGSLLTRAVLKDAKQMGIAVVYALTYRPTFFGRLGFQQVEMSKLPRKVWGECYRCPKFNDCREVPMIFELTPLPIEKWPSHTSSLEFTNLWERFKR